MKHVILAAAVAAAAATSASAVTLPSDFSAYYAFGDSLSDDGKFGALLPPSDAGRFSNGQVWTEVLGNSVAAAGLQYINLALGGATAGGADAGTGAPFRLSNLAGQVGQFADAIAAGPFGGISTGSNPLVSVWFGANDLFASLGSGSPSALAAVAAANAVGDGIRSIAGLGGQFDDFLVANLPDLGRAPAFSTLLTLSGLPADQVALASGAASDLTDVFNATLAANIATLRGEGYNIYTLDIFSLFNDVLDGPLTGDLAALAGMDLALPCTVSLTNPAANAGYPLCSDADLRLFVDGVHPNRIAHEVIAGRAAAAVVPLPATAPLLLGGIVLVGWVARRRAA